MEEIDSTAIDYSEGGYVENKRIKGLVHVHDFRYSQAVFRNCIFENDIIFFSNSDKKKIHFSFTFCTIKRIIIDCFVDYISIKDCKINVIKQSEKGETYFIEIFSDKDKKNSLENFTIFVAYYFHLKRKIYESCYFSRARSPIFRNGKGPL